MTRTTCQAMLAVAALLALAVLPAGAIDWTEWGPAPIDNTYTGRVSAIACSPTNADRYFVAGADGGIWRTTDGGQSWTPLTDQMPTSSMGALALDPADENVLYAGTGEANYANHSRYGLGLYKSTDGGDTWQVLAASTFAGRCFSRLIVHPQNSQRLYASITRAGGFPELAAAKGHPQATDPVGVFRSDDGGVTWTQLTNGLPALSATDISLAPTDSNVLYAGIGRIFGDAANGIYKSTDGGDSWTKLTSGLPATTIGRVSVTVAPSDANRVYAMLSKPASASGASASMEGAYRSDDAGATWTKMTLGNIQATYGWYLSVVAVAPTDPDEVVFGGLSLVRTANAGTNFSDITPPHVDLHAAAWDAAGRLLAGDDGGVHRSTDGGANWVSLNNGLGLIQCYAGLSRKHQGTSVFVGLQDNGTVWRQPEGPWSSILGGDGGWTQVDPTRSYVIFCEWQGAGNLYATFDSGTTMYYRGSGINAADRTAFEPPFVMELTGTSRILYATHRIYVSTTEGQNWFVLTGDLTGGGDAAIRTLARAPSDGNVIYAATTDGRILRSDDDGVNWTLVAENVPGWPRVTRELCVDPKDPMTVYLAVAYFGTEQLRRSTDGGVTWQALDQALPDLPVNTVAVDSRGKIPVIYIGTDDGVYRSLNNGASWHHYGVGLPVAPAIDIQIMTNKKRMFVATQGRGVWVIDIDLPGDMNGDGIVDLFDIDPFVLALTDPAGYATQYPDLNPILLGDMTGDGVLDNFDIDGFVIALTG